MREKCRLLRLNVILPLTLFNHGPGFKSDNERLCPQIKVQRLQNGHILCRSLTSRFTKPDLLIILKYITPSIDSLNKHKHRSLQTDRNGYVYTVS